MSDRRGMQRRRRKRGDHKIRCHGMVHGVHREAEGGLYPHKVFAVAFYVGTVQNNFRPLN